MGLTIKSTLPAQSAGGADAVTVLGAVSDVGGTDNQVVIANVIAPPGVTVTGQATDNFTISVRQLRAGSVLGTVASVTLGNGTSILAERATALAVTPTSLAKGDVLDVLLHQNGAGLAVPAGLIVQVENHFV
jgi:hypothetical protein